MPVIAGILPVVAHPATYLGAGDTVSAGIEGRAGKKEVGMKLLDAMSESRCRAFSSCFVKVVIAAGEGGVLDDVIL